MPKNVLTLPPYLIPVSLANGNVVHFARTIKIIGSPDIVCGAGKGRGYHNRFPTELLYRDCCPKCWKIAKDIGVTVQVPRPKEEERQISKTDYQTFNIRITDPIQWEKYESQAKAEGFKSLAEWIRVTLTKAVNANNKRGMQMELHRTRIESRGLDHDRTWIGICSCGWQGEHKTSGSKAELDAEDHAVYASNAEG